MDDILDIDRSAPPVGGLDDIGLNLMCAGREATFGFSCMWPIDVLGDLCGGPTGVAMPERCPNCASTKLLAAIDRRQQRNWFCTDCAVCWHPEFGQLRRVDPETCPGCGLTTTRIEVAVQGFTTDTWVPARQTRPEGLPVRSG